MDNWPTKNEILVIKVLLNTKISLREIAVRAALFPAQVQRAVVKLNKRGWLEEDRDNYRRYFSLSGDGSLKLFCDFLKKQQVERNITATKAEDMLEALEDLRKFILKVK